MNTHPVIVLMGRTHSGKTTFARMLKEQVSNLVIVETDPIALFLREQFPEIAHFDDQEHTGAFANVSLKFRIFESVLNQGLQMNAPLILANANMWKEGRRKVLEQCRDAGRHTIGIYLNLSTDLLKARAGASNRDTRVLRTSRNFENLIDKQERLFQVPEPQEFDELFEVRSEREYVEVYESMMERLMRKVQPESGSVTS